MESYLTFGNIPPDAVRRPPNPIEPQNVVLDDARKKIEDDDTKRDEYIEGFLRIYREHDQDIDYNHDGSSNKFWPAPSWFKRRIGSRVALWLRYRRDWLIRFYVWNIQYRLRNYIFFEFMVGKKPLNSPYHIQVLLHEAFSKEGITDKDIPYYDGLSGPGGEIGYGLGDYGPSQRDLFFNRKRVAQS